ncbi:MAG: zinc ribbon domain-containing protein, partial [Pleurocapsa sp.]
MSYAANLTGNQHLAIANTRDKTTINLVSSSFGQQQSQSSSFTTGIWQAPPQLYQIGTNFVLKLNGERGISHILIQANGISNREQRELGKEIEIEIQKTKDAEIESSNMKYKPMEMMKPIEQMKPMQPMKMGNMSMDINSMSMQMGNMSLNMNDTKTSTSTKLFCDQCG